MEFPDEALGVDATESLFAAPLAEPRRGVRSTTFDREDLLELRRWVTRFATSAGLSKSRATELVTAVNELATNSVLHGGGKGTLRMWKTDATLVCEVRDAGAYRQPLADRKEPGPSADDPRGLWVANQLCDLVQIRTFTDGTVVRLHSRLDTN
jgi:anti-sigma regulatory factor (Ser/Thr protein kinase)